MASSTRITTANIATTLREMTPDQLRAFRRSQLDVMCRPMRPRYHDRAALFTTAAENELAMRGERLR